MRARQILTAVCLTTVPTAAFAQSEGAEGAEAPAAEAAETVAESPTAEEPAVEEPAVEEPAVEAPAAESRPATRRFEDYAASNPATAAPAAAPAADGAPTDAASPEWQRLTEAELLRSTQTYPNVEWHGYFRFRGDTFWNLDLDTEGTSPILPPIDALLSPDRDVTSLQPIEEGSDDITNVDAERLSGANIRLRLRPIFNITEKTRIHLEMNILDNLLLGSTPDGYNEVAGQRAGIRTDTPIIGFSGSQEPPNFWNAARSSVSVTQAYGEVNTFFGTLRFGRMASQWGLGILANGGGNYSTLREPRVSYRGVSMSGNSCLDCDFGDYVDRAMFVTNLFDHYIALAWDYNYVGPTDLNIDNYFGQPRDLGQADDVRSVVASVFSRPLRDEEIAERNRTLKELRRPGFDYGAYFVARRQKLSAEGFNTQDQSTGISDLTWVNREARAFIPDLWFRLVSEPRFRTRIRLEGEVAAVLGSIGNVDPRAQNGERERDIQQVGAALEFDYTRNALSTGVNTGMATGRTFEDPDSPNPTGFGVIDSWTVRDDEPKLTNFRFDRNYFVDAIMFREIVGAITNAVYVNPFFAYDLFSKQDDTLGMRRDLISAVAMNPDATPSGEGFYGAEADLSVYYREPQYGATLMGGLYLPGNVFDAIEGRPRITGVGNALGYGVTPFPEDNAATPAFTVQGAFYWAF